MKTLRVVSIFLVAALVSSTLQPLSTPLHGTARPAGFETQALASRLLWISPFQNPFRTRANVMEGAAPPGTQVLPSHSISFSIRDQIRHSTRRDLSQLYRQIQQTLEKTNPSVPWTNDLDKRKTEQRALHASLDPVIEAWWGRRLTGPFGLVKSLWWKYIALPTVLEFPTGDEEYKRNLVNRNEAPYDVATFIHIVKPHGIISDHEHEQTWAIAMGLFPGLINRGYALEGAAPGESWANKLIQLRRTSDVALLPAKSEGLETGAESVHRIMNATPPHSRSALQHGLENIFHGVARFLGIPASDGYGFLFETYVGTFHELNNAVPVHFARGYWGRRKETTGFPIPVYKRYLQGATRIPQASIANVIEAYWRSTPRRAAYTTQRTVIISLSDAEKYVEQTHASVWRALDGTLVLSPKASSPSDELPAPPSPPEWSFPHPEFLEVTPRVQSILRSLGHVSEESDALESWTRWKLSHEGQDFFSDLFDSPVRPEAYLFVTPTSNLFDKPAYTPYAVVARNAEGPDWFVFNFADADWSPLIPYQENLPLDIALNVMGLARHEPGSIPLHATAQLISRADAHLKLVHVETDEAIDLNRRPLLKQLLSDWQRNLDVGVRSLILSPATQAFLEQLDRYAVGEPILLGMGTGHDRRYILGTIEEKIRPASRHPGSLSLSHAQFAEHDFSPVDGRVSVPLRAGAFPAIIEGTNDFVTVKTYLAQLTPHQRSLITDAYLSPAPKFIETWTTLTRHAEKVMMELHLIARLLYDAPHDPQRVLLDRIRGLLLAEDDNAVAAIQGLQTVSLVRDRESEILSLAARLFQDGSGNEDHPWLEHHFRYLLASFIAAEKDLHLLKQFGGLSVDGVIRNVRVENLGRPVTHSPTERYDAIVVGAGPNGIQAAQWSALTGRRVAVVSAELPMWRWSDPFMTLVSMRTDLGRMDPGQGLPANAAKVVGLSHQLPLLRLLTTLGRLQLQSLTGRDFKGIPNEGNALALNQSIGAAPTRAETVLAYLAALRRSGASLIVDDPVADFEALRDEDGELSGVRLITRSGRQIIASRLILATGLIGLKGRNAVRDRYFAEHPTVYRTLGQTSDLDSPSIHKAFSETLGERTPRFQWVVAASLAGQKAVEQLVLTSPIRTIGIEGGRESALKTAVHYFNILPERDRSKLTIHLFTKDPIDVTPRPVGLHTYKSRFWLRRRATWRVRFATPNERNGGQISKQSKDDLDYYIQRGQIIVHDPKGKPFDQVWRRVPVYDPEKGLVTSVYGPSNTEIAEISNFWVTAFGYNATDESNGWKDQLALGGLIELDAEGKPILVYGPKGALYLKGRGKNIVALLGASPLNTDVTLHENTGVVPAAAQGIAEESVDAETVTGPVHVIRLTSSRMMISFAEEEIFQRLIDIFHDPEFASIDPARRPKIVYADAFLQERIGKLKKKNSDAMPTSESGINVEEEADAARAFYLRQSLHDNMNVEIIPGWRQALADPLNFLNQLRTHSIKTRSLDAKIKWLARTIKQNRPVDLSDVVAFSTYDGLVLDQDEYTWLFTERSSSTLGHRILRLFSSEVEWGRPGRLILQLLDWAYVVDVFDRLLPVEQLNELITLDPEFKLRLQAHRDSYLNRVKESVGETSGRYRLSWGRRAA